MTTNETQELEFILNAVDYYAAHKDILSDAEVHAMWTRAVALQLRYDEARGLR